MVVKDLLLFSKITGLSNSQIVPHCLVEKALDKNQRNTLQAFHCFAETDVSNLCGISVLSFKLERGSYIK